jgi:hypothetical protein
MAELKLWSSTTLAKLGMGTSDPLVNWAIRTTAEAAVDRGHIVQAMLKDGDRDGAVKWLCDQRWAKTSVALARGTDVHRAAEARALGEPVDIDPQNIPLLEQYDQFLADFQPEFLMAEAPVYNVSAGYAGTLDAIVKIDGQTLVLDLKTTQYGKDSGKTRPPFPEVALQLVSYRRAEYVGVLAERRYTGGKRYYLFNPDAEHPSMPETDGAACLVISPDDYMLCVVDTSDRVWKAWRHVMEVARWQVETSRNVIGTPLSGPQAVIA